MAAHENGLKVISFAFKDMSLVALNTMMHENNIESKEFREGIEHGLVYLCTFGLEDPLRESILETCQIIKYGHYEKDINESNKAATVNIKMVTGDHIETAKKVALACGIITAEEANDHSIVMSGADFINAIGPYDRSIWNEETE